MPLDLTPGTLSLLIIGGVLLLWRLDRMAQPAIQRVLNETESWVRLYTELLIVLLLVTAITLSVALPFESDGDVAIKDQPKWLKEVFGPGFIPVLAIASLALLLRWRIWTLLAAGPGALACVLGFAYYQPTTSIPFPYANPAQGIPIAETIGVAQPLLILLITALFAAVTARLTRRLWPIPFAAAVGCCLAHAFIPSHFEWNEGHFRLSRGVALFVGFCSIFLIIPPMRITRDTIRVLIGIDERYPWRPRHEAGFLLVVVTTLAGAGLHHLHSRVWGALLLRERTEAVIPAYPAGAITIAEVIDRSLLLPKGEAVNSRGAERSRRIEELNKPLLFNPASATDWTVIRDFWLSPLADGHRAFLAEQEPLLANYHRASRADVTSPMGDWLSPEGRLVNETLELAHYLRLRAGKLMADGDYMGALADVEALLAITNPADSMAGMRWWRRPPRDAATRILAWYPQAFPNDPEAMRAAMELIAEHRRMVTVTLGSAAPADIVDKPYQIRPALLIRWRQSTGYSAGRVHLVRFINNLTTVHTICAVQLFILEEGRKPTGLEELVPAYIHVIPREILSGKPLVYTIAEDGMIHVTLPGDPIPTKP